MEKIDSQILYVCLLALVIAVFCALLQMAGKAIRRTRRGRAGEKAVAGLLRHLPKRRYRLINNVLLRNKYGTSQIDHIVVSVYGIFVVETKNYKGQIFGKEHSDQWKQNLYGVVNYFRNPLYQNYGHIKTLRVHLKEYAFVPVISIVAFSDGCQLHVNTKSHVIYWKELKRTIRSYRKKVLTRQSVDQIVAAIEAANIDSREMRREHRREVREKIKTRK